MKVAVVLFVKDDAKGIFSWLGWYKTLGIDSVIVFDDHSLDGTASFAEDASHEFDIRVTRLPPSSGPHAARQKESYIEAIKSLYEEFDWLGFLDADEYLKIVGIDDIHEFLGKFGNDVSQICINWCNYGSSGHLSRPPSPPFFAYINHMRPDEAVNRHVKSFIRPMRWGGGWSNVHSFDITTGRTVNTNSEDIVWSSITGIIDGAPIWDAAKIMHYQCGSMEDFIARSRRRQDIKVTAAQWSEHDKNDIHDTDPREKILDVRRWMGIAFLWTIRRIAVDLKIMIPYIEHEKINSNNEGCQYYPETLNMFAIKTAFGNFLEVLDNGFVRQTASPDLISTSNPLLGIEIGNSKKLALFSAKDLCVPYIVDDPRVSSFLAYDIYSLPDKGKIALRHPSTNYFLSVEPISAGGNVQANRNMVKGWEEFSLAPLEDYHNYTDKDVARILSLVAEKMHENWSMADLRKNQVPNSREGAIILEALIEFMDNDDRAVIQSRLQGASDLII